MGRGSSKAGGGGAYSATVVTVQSGDKLDLSDMPLVYGAKDNALTGKAREEIEAFESKRRSYKVEYAHVVDEDGTVLINDLKGTKNGVKLPYLGDAIPITMSHNHPRGKGEEGLLGGTFSDTDLRTFSKPGYKTMRATAAEGTYSITKSKGFDSMEFKNFINRTTASRHLDYKDETKKIRKDYSLGKISLSEANKSLNMAFNKYLINCHNDLLANQKKYGYTYTLEKN